MKPDNLKKFWRNTGFSLFQQVSTMLLAIALLPYMLWQLGTERYGLWLILQIFNILGLAYLAELGFHGAIVRRLVRFHAAGDRAGFRRLLWTGFFMFVAIGLVTCIIVVIFAQTVFVDWFDIDARYAAEMKLALSVYAAGLAIGFPTLILKGFFAAQQDVATQKIWETIDRLLFAILIVALLFYSDSLVYMAVLEQAIALAMAGVFLVVAAIRYGEWFAFRLADVRFAHLRGILRLSGAVFVTNATNHLLLKAPDVLIGAILGPVSLAYYQIAVRLPRVLKTFQGAFNAAVLPYVASIDGESEREMQQKSDFTLQGLRLNYIVITPLAVFLAVFAAQILTVWVGSEYRFLGQYTALYALWIMTSVSITFATATLMRPEHFQKLIYRNLVISAGFVAVLVLGLEGYGLPIAFGAIVASGIASALSALLAFKRANRLSTGQIVRNVLVGPVLLNAAVGGGLFMAASMVFDYSGVVAGLITTLAAGMAHLCIIYAVILRDEEQAFVKRLVTRGITAISPKFR